MIQVLPKMGDVFSGFFAWLRPKVADYSCPNCGMTSQDHYIISTPARVPTQIQDILWMAIRAKMPERARRAAGRQLSMEEATRPLSSFGLKALDVVEVIMELEEYAGVEIRDDALEQPITIHALVMHVHELRGEKW